MIRTRKTAPRMLPGLRSVFAGPPVIALLPALMLAAYWFGGEGVLFFCALILPGLVALSSIASNLASGPAVDGLTGMPLRAGAVLGLSRALATAESTGRSACAIAMQIDDLDDIRRLHGPAACDTVIERVADRLTTALRGEDVVARLGSASFAVIPCGLRRADLETALQIVARLQAAVAEPIGVDGIRIYVTLSCGFCIPSRSPGEGADAMLDAAEAALVEARRNGPGAIRAYSAEVTARLAENARLVHEAAAALDSGEIVAWFQPQISTDTGLVEGFEALARWEHPEFGRLAPSEFLPALEEAGQIERLGEVMLTQSLAALRNWQKAGHDVAMVGVNISGNELRNPKLVEKIRWELDRFDIAPGRLAIEILEDALEGGGSEVQARNVRALSELGVMIDLDDFGTGTSAISAIRRFNVSRLKIDRSYVTGIDRDRGQQEMVAAILTMAHQLGLLTLAEGVETAGEHALLAQLGCDAVQGYAIAQPMPFAGTLTFLDQQRRISAQTPKIGKKAV